jgi:hypothetical protein
MAKGDTVVGTGTTFKWNQLAPIFAIEVTSISIDGPEAAIVDVSHLGSTTLREKLVGDLLEPGTLTVEGHFKSTYDVDDITKFVGHTDDIEIITGSTSVWTWPTAVMTSFSANIPLEDVETCTATFQLASALGVA